MARNCQTKRIGEGIRLVGRIMKSLRKKGCECFTGYMMDVEAEIFNDIELFKDIDNAKLDIELKSQKKLKEELFDALAWEEKIIVIQDGILKGHDYFDFSENRDMPSVVFDDYRGRCVVTRDDVVYTPRNSDKSINFKLIITSTGIEFSDLANE